MKPLCLLTSLWILLENPRMFSFLQHCMHAQLMGTKVRSGSELYPSKYNLQERLHEGHDICAYASGFCLRLGLPIDP